MTCAPTGGLQKRRGGGQRPTWVGQSPPLPSPLPYNTEGPPGLSETTTATLLLKLGGQMAACCLSAAAAFRLPLADKQISHSRLSSLARAARTTQPFSPRSAAPLANAPPGFRHASPPAAALANFADTLPDTAGSASARGAGSCTRGCSRLNRNSGQACACLRFAATPLAGPGPRPCRQSPANTAPVPVCGCSSAIHRPGPGLGRGGV